MRQADKFRVKPVILCGGSGTRLWPLSTTSTPKQFLRLLSDRTMVEMTADRVAGDIGDVVFASPLAVGSSKHANLLSSMLPDAQLILEPVGRNSAPAIAAACLAVDKDEILLVLPADHNIANLDAFHEAIRAAARLAADDAIVTFGIKPTHAATGYGYIKARNKSGAHSPVEAFVEKPKLDVAEAYLEDGGYFWNAGIFMFKASTMLAALEEFEPEILPVVSRAMTKDEPTLDEANFVQAKNISIDYAVMERASNTMVVPVDMGWSDVGGYRAIHELLGSNETSTVVHGPVQATDTDGAYIRSEGPRVLVSGVKDLAIIATDEAIMIVPKSNDDAVKALGSAFKQNRDSLHVAEDTKVRASEFLRSAFDVWSDVAWDENQGGFVEQLSLDGTPDTAADRRLRVQARQVFSFSKAAQNDWLDKDLARDLAEKGLDYLLSKGRHRDGGFVHRLSPAGETISDVRDFYDHAFVILAGATCYDAFGMSEARDMAVDALAFLNDRLFDEQNRGWFDALPKPEYRRANPHMHLLEATTELHAATGLQDAATTAKKVVALFESDLFRGAEDELVEMFGLDWTPHGAPGQAEIEPGHHFEWATLLTLHQRSTGHDTLSWQRRLIDRAQRAGIDHKDGLAYNAVTALGAVRNGRKRLWPQLEMLRSLLLHPAAAPAGSVDKLFAQINKTYIEGMPRGLWIDEIDENGKLYSKAVPSSMLYHFVTAFGMLR